MHRIEMSNKHSDVINCSHQYMYMGKYFSRCIRSRDDAQDYLKEDFSAVSADDTEEQ